MIKVNKILTFGFVSAGFTTVFAGNPDKPNIIWVMAEDISNDLSCYGAKGVHTPVLDMLAAEGIRFTHCYGTGSISSPNRSAMMTGMYQTAFDAQHHRSNRNVPLPGNIRPITYWLRNAGYTCILGNKAVQNLGRKTDCNFKHTPVGKWDGVNEFGLFDKFDEFTKADQPFFAQIQLQTTHRGDWWFEKPAISQRNIMPEEVELPPYIADTPELRADWIKYLQQIEFADYEMGLIMQQLKEKGLYDNTIVIFIGDNGRDNIRGKGNVYDASLRVPLIVWCPSRYAAKQENSNLVDLTDVSASILKLAGAEIPDYITGVPFLGVKTPDYKTAVYSARDRWDEIRDCSRSVTTKKYKYIKNYIPEVPHDAGQSYLEFHRPAVHFMRNLYAAGKLTEAQAMFFMPQKPYTEELYDLELDPHELRNIAGNKQYATVLDSMRNLLIQFQKQYPDHGLAQLEKTRAEVKNNPDKQPTQAQWVKQNRPDWWNRVVKGEHVPYDSIQKAYNIFYGKQNKNND